MSDCERAAGELDDAGITRDVDVVKRWRLELLAWTTVEDCNGKELTMAVVESK